MSYFYLKYQFDVKSATYSEVFLRKKPELIIWANFSIKKTSTGYKTDEL